VTPLASSNLAGYDYQEDTRLLKITFQSGRTYIFNDVPQDVVDGLAQASSPGQYFNANIKNTYG
jgi:lysyl-tRNA synthetase class 2